MGFNAADFMPENTLDSGPSWGQVEDMAAAGDPAARRVTAGLMRRTGDIVGNRDRLDAKLVRRIDETRRQAEEARRRNAAKEKAAVERERLMVKLTVAGVVFGALGWLSAIVSVLAG